MDAFQADHADNPLLTILSAVLAQLPEGEGKKTLLQKALPLARFAVTTLAKAAVGHVFHQSEESLAEGVAKSLQDAADKAIDASVKNLLKEHEMAQANLKALQFALEAVAQDSPIVLFIDELDRCRPDFAVQMLEVIKHTFNAKGVQFVLVTNSQQLRAAIEHRYGSNVEAKRYLDKFVRFSFCLPDFLPDKSIRIGRRVLASTEHFSLLVSRNSALSEAEVSKEGEYARDLTESLISINSLSLREVETFVRHLGIYNHLSTGLEKNTVAGYQFLRIFGVFVFCFSPKIAEAIHKRTALNADTVAGLLGLQGLPVPDPDRCGYPISSSVGVMLAQACSEANDKYCPEDPDLKKFWQEEIAGFFSRPGRPPNDVFKPVQEAIFCMRLGSK